MRSFGLWYKKNVENAGNPVFSVHMNFWSESMKKGESNPSLDIGIKVKNFEKVKEIVFHCPFVFSEDQMVDLASKLKSVKNANLIFNTDGKIEEKELHSIYLLKREKQEETILLLPLKKETASFHLKYELNVDDEKSDIKFDFTEFNDHINSLKKKNDIREVDEVYIRFRITSDSLKDRIYFDTEPSNKSFESAFTGTRVFDFKINEKRNLGSNTISVLDKDNYEFPQIDVIHLLLMEPSSYDLEAFANPQMTCRELEGELWKDYFENEIDYSNGKILAYHWKFENKDSCSCLIKVKYSKTDKKIIISYVFIVLALGILGSAFVSMVQYLYKDFLFFFCLISYGIAVVLFGFGLILGNKK